MKKFKRFLFILLSALCVFAAFSFGGCKKQEGFYIDGSFRYDEIDNSYYSTVWVEGSFKVYLPEAGNYTVNYTVTVRGTGESQTKSSYNTYTVAKGEEKTVTFSMSFNKKESETYNNARISNVTVTRNEVESNYSSYAIGFGVTAGVLLVGAVVIFVLDKSGVFKKRK